MNFFKYICIGLLAAVVFSTPTYAVYCDELGPDDDYTTCTERPSPVNTGGPRTVADPKESLCTSLFFLSDGWYTAGCASVKTGLPYTLISGYCADKASVSIRDPHWLRLGCDGIVRPNPAPGMTGGGAPPIGIVNNMQQGNSTYNSAGSSQSSASELATCTAIKFSSLLDIMIWVKCVIVVAVIPLIFTLAFLVFLWGVLRFMYASESKDKEAAKSFIWWGLVGLFVMVSVWGILRILSDTLGLDTTVPLLQTSYLTK